MMRTKCAFPPRVASPKPSRAVLPPVSAMARTKRGGSRLYTASWSAVFARRKHTPRGGDREHPDCRINVAGNCRPGRGAVDEPAFSGLAAEDGGLLVGGELDARDPLHRARENAPRLDMRSRGIDRPAAGYRNDADQANHQAGRHP